MASEQDELILELIAKVDGLKKGLGIGEKEVKKKTSSMKKSFGSLSPAIKSIGKAFIAAFAAAVIYAA